MAFKMKGGKDPMKKNFPDLTGDNKVTQADILKGRGVFKMKKDNAPMMRMDNSAMKAMGKPAPVKAMDKSPIKDVDEKAFEKLKRNKLQVNLDKKRELNYSPQSQEGKDKFTKFNPSIPRLQSKLTIKRVPK